MINPRRPFVLFVGSVLVLAVATSAIMAGAVAIGLGLFILSLLLLGAAIWRATRKRHQP